jgi:hypothetical protein
MDLFMICICLVGLTCLGALSGAIVRSHGYNLLRWHGVILTAACLIAFVVFVYGNEFSRWPLISASALIIGYATGLALFWNRTPWNDRRNFVSSTPAGRCRNRSGSCLCSASLKMSSSLSGSWPTSAPDSGQAKNLGSSS